MSDDVKFLGIPDWGDRYENNRTRELKKTQWVPLPNKHDGDGYTQLICSSKGPLKFAAWVLILQVASKCDPRGMLVRDNGKPYNSEVLCRITRAPKNIFDEAIPELLNIGWLQVFTKTSQDGATIPHYVAQNGMEWNGKNGMKRKEGKGYSDSFLNFWKTYPLKVGKGSAWTAWQSRKCDSKHEEIMTSLKNHLTCKQWTKENGDFIPHASTWINGSRWEDEPEQSVDPDMKFQDDLMKQCGLEP